MNNREKQILAYRTAFIAGAFSFIVCIVMLLNFWQLTTSDPLESEALKHLVERLQEDAQNEELKVEIRNLDLMTRNAFFTNHWQIRSGAFLLIGGIITLVIALRIYFSLKSKIKEPDSEESQLDIELLISRRWIVYTVSIIFGLALLASFLSIDHLSETYALTEVTEQKDEIPVQEIKPLPEGTAALTRVVDEPVAEIAEVSPDSPEPNIPPKSDQEIKVAEAKESVPEKTIREKSVPAIPSRNEIIKNFPASEDLMD